MNLIEMNINVITDLCKRHKVRQLFVFGSVLTKRFKKNSDIDFIVEFQDVELYDYADNYFEIADKFELLLSRPIDLVPEKSLRNPYFIETVNKSKTLIFIKDIILSSIIIFKV